MAHRYSQPSHSAADAYSPPLSSSTAPMLGNDQYGSEQGRTQRYPSSDDNDFESEGELYEAKGGGVLRKRRLPREGSGLITYASSDWNVYDDFNNIRPKAPTLSKDPAGIQHGQMYVPNAQNLQKEQQKQQNRKTLIPSGSFGFDAQNSFPQIAASSGDIGRPYLDGGAKSKTEGTDVSDIELITVPALGDEYTSDEIKAMKKPHKRRHKARSTRDKAQRWIKKDDRYCGGLSPRLAVFLVFSFCVVLGILLYFVIPRVPTMAVQTVTPLIAVPDGASMKTNHRPTNFSMEMKVNLRADNVGGWITTKVKKMDIIVRDISTSKKVGSGTLFDQKFPGRKRTPFQFPVSFAYASLNATGDETWRHWINACGPKYANTARQSLNLQFIVSMSIEGLLGARVSSAQLSDLECPFTLQSDQT